MSAFTSSHHGSVIRCQFHQHFTQNFDARRSRKPKKIDNLTVIFSNLGSSRAKAFQRWWNGTQILFKRGEFFQPATFQQGFRYLTGIGFVYMVAVTLRAIGRATNPVYKEFLVVLDKAIKEPTQVNKVSILNRLNFLLWKL